MKKILISVSIITAVAAIALGITTAFFSDTEKSTGNTFTAGTLDLKVDSQCKYNGVEQSGCTWLTPKDLAAGDLFFNFNDVKPGDDGEDTISLHVDTNDAYVCAGISNLKNEENGCTSPEKKVEPNCEVDNIGELQNNLLFTVWKDNGAGDHKCNNILDTDETTLVNDQPTTNGYWPIADSNTGGPLAGNTTACIGVSWRIPENVGNGIQTDKLSADISFDAIQARHIPQFFCTAQGGCAPQTEMCNGEDDDCDGLVDEGWVLGEECSVGGGACQATGTYVCSPTSPLADPICSAVAGQPSTEICTGGVDEDCDGYIDCGDTSDCANNQACQIITNTRTMRLENKFVTGDWHVIDDGTYGNLTYNPSGSKFDYHFTATGLTPGGNYNLIYYPDPWANPKTVVLIGGTIMADPTGNIDTGNQSVELGMDLPNSAPGFDSNYPTGAKVWLVVSTSLSGNQLSWTNIGKFLYETDWVNYDDTDVASPETISLTDLGAASQYGYYHNYGPATVTFLYTTPATGKIIGTITATGLKPYATYQLKFDGKPTCQYGAAGDDATNEKIGYLGRWWDNTTNSNTNDANYLINSIYHGGTHCITGYLVWGYVTADASGNASKVVTTDSSYHVLWCGGGTCDTVSNAFLTQPDLSHPTINFCAAGNVDGELERGTCGGMSFAAGTYKLGVSLTEESFHQGPGTWTTVMGGNIEFKIN